MMVHPTNLGLFVVRHSAAARFVPTTKREEPLFSAAGAELDDGV